MFEINKKNKNNFIQFETEFSFARRLALAALFSTSSSQQQQQNLIFHWADPVGHAEIAVAFHLWNSTRTLGPSSSHPLLKALFTNTSHWQGPHIVDQLALWNACWPFKKAAIRRLTTCSSISHRRAHIKALACWCSKLWIENSLQYGSSRLQFPSLLVALNCLFWLRKSLNQLCRDR